jgi:16S rRNA (guanine(527)-N(7))-methyltransferase RsmG
MPLLEVLETELLRFQLELTTEQKSTLTRYGEELVRWNTKINLTGLKDADLVRRLIVEPVWIGEKMKLTGTLVDVGSGNGSPAIPLHIVSGLSEMHLIEARAKRAAFLRHMVHFLELKEVVVHRMRLEEAGADLRRVDWVSLQGVALTAELVAIIRKKCSPTTRVVWITSEPSAPIPPVEILHVPFTRTEVLIFQLDLC